jgi:broad specificity phosphatase PhoE
VKQAFFARHGESDYSVRGLLNGDVAVSVGLTDAGRAQVTRLRKSLRNVPVDLCVTTQLERVQLTADGALDGRDVPRLVIPELNDPLYGPYEGRGIDDYRTWATAATSRDTPGAGGESRYSIVERYALGFRIVLDRDEETILVVAHSLPISYLLGALEGLAPAARAPMVPYAVPYGLTAAELERAIEVLDAWLAAPSW